MRQCELRNGGTADARKHPTTRCTSTRRAIGAEDQERMLTFFSNHAFIFVMSSNPHPQIIVSIFNGKCPMTEADSH